VTFHSAREQILARIRYAHSIAPPDPVDIPRDYERVGPYPAGSVELLDLLAGRLADYRAVVHRTTDAGLRGTLASIVDGYAKVVVPPGAPARWLPSSIVDDGTLTPAQLDAMDAVVTGCAAAAAETGTILLDGSANQGRRAITLIPDRHICVVYAGQVVHNVPELLSRLDPRRPLTFISGPSATSDIELQRVEGVHGPRTLIVVLVNG
jgi:L-lactate dehydrogenase complex protein LldG